MRRFRRKLSTSARTRLRQRLAVRQQYPTTAECQENWEPPQTTDPEIIQAMEPERPELPVGGRLQFFKHRWSKLTSDPAILDIVTGMHIELTSDIPYQKCPPPPYPFSTRNSSSK